MAQSGMALSFVSGWRQARTTVRMIVLSALLAGGTAAPVMAACSERQIALRSDRGTAQFSVEIADDEAERARGLMFRAQMARGAGMLFLYDTPQSVAFWMRNTLIPLDMVFIDAKGVVRRVHPQAIPGDETAIPGGDDILAVLEINGGLAARLGIGEGAQAQHPAFGPDAAWPCE